MNVQIFIHFFPVLVTKLLERARMLELQETLGKRIKAKGNKMDMLKSHSTLVYTTSLSLLIYDNHSIYDTAVWYLHVDSGK